MIQLYCMHYITTNIRIPEKDYLNLKMEAAKKRKSLAAIIRGKISAKEQELSNKEVGKIMAETRKLAKENTKKLKGFDIVKALREIRNEDR